MKQLNVSLPDELRDALEACARANKHSVANEIRRRLEQSVRVDNLDPQAPALISLLLALISEVHQITGQNFSSHPKAFETLMLVLQSGLNDFKPKKAPAGGDPLADDDASTLARAVLRRWDSVSQLRGEISEIREELDWVAKQQEQTDDAVRRIGGYEHKDRR